MMDQCVFCGADLPVDAGFCGNCGRARQENDQATRTIDTPTPPLKSDPEANVLTALSVPETLAASDMYPGVVTESSPTIRENWPAGPLTPPVPGREEDEEEKRRRAALAGMGPLLLGNLATQQSSHQIPTIQGTPPFTQMPTISGTPQVQGGISMAPHASPMPSAAQYPQPGQHVGHSLKPKPTKGPSGCTVAGVVTAIALVGLSIVSAVLGFTLLAPTMSLSGSAAVAPGGVLRVHGEHFLPNSVISLTLDAGSPVQFTRAPQPSRAHAQAAVLVDLQLANSTLHASGSGTFDITIPADPGWTPGAHTLHATESPTTRSATIPFTLSQSTTATPAPAPTDTPTPTPTPTPTTAPTGPTISNFLGVWFNVDPNTNDWVRVEITADGNTLIAHFFGACSPTPCDAGSASAPFTGDPVSLQLVESFATRDITLLLNGNMLQVTTHTNFTDNSGRSDYTTQDTFHQ